MAISSNRSPSPTQNPNSRPDRNPRNSENSPMRRSFTGNPFQRPSIHTTNQRGFVPATPVNSPADFLSRNFLGMVEKENEKENQTLKPVKARSPAVVKGTNHFMIPTISAASKINSSPRKKALADINESIRTSLSFSDNTEDFDQKSDKGFNSKDLEIKFYETPSKPNLSQKLPPNIPLLTPTNFSKSADVKKVTFSSSISPNIAPLDADPSLPPYDPKTNYLSPRPQFLHYIPNSRLELNSSGTKNLEDGFLSENVSDCEVSEESEPENSQKESEDASPVEVINENSPKESENASLVEEAELEVSEPEPITSLISTNVSKVTSEEKRVAKLPFLTSRKLISLLLVLFACSSVFLINSPLLDSLPVYEKLSSSKFYEEGFNGVARNLNLWSVRSTSYINELISRFTGVEKSGPLQYFNMTCTLEDPFNDVKRFEEIYEQDEEEPVLEDEDELESPLDRILENEHDSEEKSSLEALESSPEESAPQLVKGDDQLICGSEIESSTAVSSLEIETSASVSDVQSSEQVIHLVSDLEIDSSAAIPHFGNILGKVNSKVDSEFHSETLKSENTLEMDAYTSDLTPEYKPTELYKTPAMSLLALGLIASTVLVYFKNKNANTSNSTVLSNPILINKEMNLDPQNYSPEDDLASESCPSEMSSFDKSYSYGKRENWVTTNETQSQERKQKRVLKRESLASSTDFSMNSPSYGSFTTYERLPSKHGYGDDEVVTPVRRSSRIKKI